MSTKYAFLVQNYFEKLFAYAVLKLFKEGPRYRVQIIPDTPSQHRGLPTTEHFWERTFHFHILVGVPPVNQL